MNGTPRIFAFTNTRNVAPPTGIGTGDPVSALMACMTLLLASADFITVMAVRQRKTQGTA
jgi:hypothetical protein